MQTKNNAENKYEPSDSEVQRYLDVWDQLDSYVCQEVALTNLFQMFPNNTEVGDVLIKCCVLNDFYSAGVRTIDLHKLAEHIVSCDIDDRLRNGDWTVVEHIANCKGIHNYRSFASKYCNWHNPKNFPIYDSYVDSVVWSLKKDNKINSFKNRDELKKIKTFGNALIDIAKKFKLSLVLDSDSNHGVNFKILDKYLWLLGKHKFSKSETVTVRDIKKALKGSVSRATFGDYVIVRTANGSIKVTKNGGVMPNTKEALRQISKEIDFAYNDDWNTRQFGKKLIDYFKGISINSTK